MANIFDMSSLKNAIEFLSGFTQMTTEDFKISIIDQIWDLVGKKDESNNLREMSYDIRAKRDLISYIPLREEIDSQMARVIILKHVEKIVEDLNIDYTKVKLSDIMLVFYHATSSIDNCNDASEIGLFPLDEMLSFRNSLTDFLNNYGISFDLDNGLIIKKTATGIIENEYKLNELTNLGFPSYLQKRFTNDCYINGVWCPYDHLEVFNQTDHYFNAPEFLKYVENIFTGTNLTRDWHFKKESYLLKCSIPLSDLDIQTVRTLKLGETYAEFIEAVYNDEVELKKYLVRLAFERLIEGVFLSNNIVHVKKHIPSDRIEIIPMEFVEGVGYIPKQNIKFLN